MQSERDELASKLQAATESSGKSADEVKVLQAKLDEATSAASVSVPPENVYCDDALRLYGVPWGNTRPYDALAILVLCYSCTYADHSIRLMTRRSALLKTPSMSSERRLLPLKRLNKSSRLSSRPTQSLSKSFPRRLRLLDRRTLRWRTCKNRLIR